jgi:hypothetical protein
MQGGNTLMSNEVKATCANFAQAADNGKTYNYKFYSLAAIAFCRRK